jgi:hypothetical protein
MSDVTAVFCYVPMVKKLVGLRDAILITLTVCGLKGVASCLPMSVEVCDKD